MERILHNKKQNTGLLFELLSQQVVSSTVSKNDIKVKKALYLIRKYFKPGTQLYEELQIINAIMYNEVANWRIASKLLSEVLVAATKIDQKKLADEKFKLLTEINANFDKHAFFSSFVSNYRVYGATYSLIEASRKAQIIDVTQKVKLEEVVLQHLMNNTEVKRINEFAKKKSEFGEVDDLAFKFVIKKFNSKYDKVLTESQKEILHEYITATSDRKYDAFVEKAKRTIEHSLYESMKTVKDKGLLQKIYEAMMKFAKIDEATQSNKTAMLMSYAQLIDELKKLDEGK